MSQPLFGLVGRKLGHSYSVPIHKALGNSAYRLIELEPDELPSFFERDDIRGLNITLPYKREAVKFCGELSPEARYICSVNTVVRDDGRLLKGFNTDLYGFRYMAEITGIRFAGKKVIIFGSGGASLMVRFAAESEGASEVVTISRTGKNNYDNLSCNYDAEIIVNATPVGMYPNTGIAVADLSFFKKCTGVLDLIYNPRRTALLIQAESLSIPCSDGLPMLVAQAKAAEEIFFEREISDTEIERVLEELRHNMSNIVLIGMPGSGKNTVGAALSEITGREMIDTDLEIEKRSGMSVSEIFSRYGEAEFRLRENEEILRAGSESGKIIITGGGAVKDINNYAPLHQNGRIYHLTRETSLLSREGRPLSENADLEAMHKHRLPMYKRFRDSEICNADTPEEAAQYIWQDFCKNT